jgi:hypothetical protein
MLKISIHQNRDESIEGKTINQQFGQKEEDIDYGESRR